MFANAFIRSEGDGGFLNTSPKAAEISGISGNLGKDTPGITGQIGSLGIAPVTALSVMPGSAISSTAIPIVCTALAAEEVSPGVFGKDSTAEEVSPEAFGKDSIADSGSCVVPSCAIMQYLLRLQTSLRPIVTEHPKYQHEYDRHASMHYQSIIFLRQRHSRPTSF